MSSANPELKDITHGLQSLGARRRNMGVAIMQRRFGPWHEVAEHMVDERSDLCPCKQCGQGAQHSAAVAEFAEILEECVDEAWTEFWAEWVRRRNQLAFEVQS